MAQSLRTIGRQRNRLEKALPRHLPPILHNREALEVSHDKPGATMPNLLSGDHQYSRVGTNFQRRKPGALRLGPLDTESAIFNCCTPLKASSPACPALPFLPSSFPPSPPKSMVEAAMTEVIQSKVEHFDISSPPHVENDENVMHFCISTPEGHAAMKGSGHKKRWTVDAFAEVNSSQCDSESTSDGSAPLVNSSRCDSDSPSDGLAPLDKETQKTKRYRRRLPAGAWLVDCKSKRDVAVEILDKTKMSWTLLGSEVPQVFEKMSLSVAVSEESTEAGSDDVTDDFESMCERKDASAVDVLPTDGSQASGENYIHVPVQRF